MRGMVVPMVSVLNLPRGLSLKEKTYTLYTVLLSISGIRSKSRLSEGTLKSAGVDPIEVKAKKEDGSPTFSYPCYPPWDEDKTFRRMNTETTYGRSRSDWRTDVGMDAGGEMRIWWDEGE